MAKHTLVIDDSAAIRPTRLLVALQRRCATA